MTKELAENVKRLRELAKCTEAMTEQSIFKSVRQLNMQYEQGCNDIITLSDGLLDANKTINALVALVGEMSDVIMYAETKEAMALKMIETRSSESFNMSTQAACSVASEIVKRSIDKYSETLTKAAPIAALAKGECELLDV